MTVLRNEYNQGYGGNQKVGYAFAIREGFDFVAMVHGDGQYAPEELPTLVAPLRDGEADAVFGSRMMTRFGALKGGMPLYKYVGNRILTGCRTCCSARSFSEFHSGYRIYSVHGAEEDPVPAQLERLPLRHRDHHPAAQREAAHRRAADPDLLRRRDLPRERDEVRQGRDAWRRCGTSRTARACSTSAASIRSSEQDNAHYDLKLGYAEQPPVGARRGARRARRCWTSAPARAASRASWSRRAARSPSSISHVPRPDRRPAMYVSSRQDLDDELTFDVRGYDYLLLLDVIEHLKDPETLPRAAARAVRLRAEDAGPDHAQHRVLRPAA